MDRFDFVRGDAYAMTAKANDKLEVWAAFGTRGEKWAVSESHDYDRAKVISELDIAHNSEVEG